MSSKPIPEGHYAQLANGYRLHYLDEGQGPVIVFLHGSGNGASGYSNFKHNYPALVQAGYRCLVLDMIGFGYSDKPTDVEYPLSFFVECLKQLLDTLKIARCTLVGNSLGGAVALGFALDHPEQTERLVLMAPGGLNELPEYLAMPGMAMMFGLFNSSEPVTEARMKDFFRKAFVVNGECVDDALVHERFELMKLQNPQVMKTLKVPNLSERLHEIRVPVLALWGLNENMMPESGILKLAKNLPDCRMVLVPQCGHWVMIEHRALFNRTVLDFLQNG
ncbi:4,5:9,10-diseco-3-hydroxy-5,9,17-trioxoandrosta-1(10),2-diene-4-oate hydrolase [Solimonas aquatica]|uniref:4,5:9,10-diseco-3-hydroxy-5,9,17-trioxoandrosta-1(10),2-diene-4-oate hydrolase n=1 Tax=Solimonas aquatica TaxID=489703 RepID=A0A1H9KVP9_9GAMM|nr:alpha/beta hydrolase [Solimonas aquatica]SER03109.1 4,5:9,10-diseco-3-hydroxy-5,9,17-trioxoandrosta-1(10),2-diene-4-oate hydrolase [Solimonas aquatica]